MSDSKESRDTLFIPAIITDNHGIRHKVFRYKPQKLIITGYITEELAEDLGFKIEEVDHE